jgi:D-alanyl-D-alanine carboxypeptidase/D-alanyl-D-alanine-endopeptidase (penicillin-binding protein 4)
LTRRTCVILLVLAFALLASPAAASASLGGKISSIVQSSRYAGPGTGIVIIDDTAGRVIYRFRQTSQLKPASNMKLTTAVAALSQIGAGTRLSTRVYRTGTLSGGTLTGSLWLVGGGDPTFSTRLFGNKAFGGRAGSVGDLADAVRAAGIRRVTGRVVGDESAFDDARTGPLWPPSYWIECPPISALSVNMSLREYGRPHTYSSPAARAADVFRKALIKRGVRVDKGTRVKEKPSTAVLVAGENSPRIYRIVQRMNQPSDNYLAEVLNKGVAVATGRQGTMRNGRMLRRAYLESLGIDMTGARLYDGSGLSPGDRLSPRQILGLLRQTLKQPFAAVFRKSLPVAGVSGTLRRRMRSGPAYGNAQAKTGTLNDASALSGYVRTQNGHRMIFSIIINRSSLNIDAARALQDRIVQTLAGASPRG